MKKKVLIIEPDFAVRTLLEELIKTKGYEVIATQHGLQGVAELEKNSDFYAVITALELKNQLINGVKVAKMAKEKCPEAKVIIFSGDFTVMNGNAEFADYFISKPYCDEILSLL
ncbi:MAG: response regulator [Patescibacteria group bacterium]|nr:response regulator [Patescibacteria group bacterium]